MAGERILLRPGADAGSESVVLELSNPCRQEALNAGIGVQSAEAALENLRVQLQNDLLTQQAQVASIEADYKQAQMDAEANSSRIQLEPSCSSSHSCAPTR